MKLILILILLTLSIPMFSQTLECCKTVEEVKNTLTGEWKLKGTSNNTSYRFSFNDVNGSIEVLQELNLPPKAQTTILGSVTETQKAPINIKLLNGIFVIDISYDFGTISEHILELNDSQFIYGNKVSEHVFIRDAN